MADFCTLCGKYVDLVPDRDVFGLNKPTDDNVDLVCDQCVNGKLHFGDPIGGCLYGDEGADYYLQRYGVSMSSDGPHIFAKHTSNPMICQDHFDQLVENDKDHTLSIEDALTSEEQRQPPDVPIPESVGQEEDEYLEYKETFQYNTYNNQQDKGLKSKVTKEVAAFGNSNGGVVVIGVSDDDNQIEGLERDYRSMDKGRDGFKLEVGDVIDSAVGSAFAAECVSIGIHEIDGKDICAIHVDPSPNPLFIEGDDFYVRQGSSSRPFSAEEAVEYISNHWET